MSYTPTEWKRGDVVTSEKLNKIEQGISEAGSGGGGGGEVLLVTASLNQDDEYELDKTYAEIATANWAAVVHDDSGVMRVGYVCYYAGSGEQYGVAVQGWGSTSAWNTPLMFVSDSPDGVLVEYSG